MQSSFGKEVVQHYLSTYKNIYVSMFRVILAEQIAKYVQRNRIDTDFPKQVNLKTATPEMLHQLMNKTFRSDMSRRNDVWNMIADYTAKLNAATLPKDIFIYIDRLNNCVHNTNTSVMDKLSNYPELKRAFDNVHNIQNVSYLEKMVDKDIRSLNTEDPDTNVSESHVINFRRFGKT